ncbi:MULTISPECIES: DMT family transporter [unclassified Roseivivax]|uniref:DMT family transporter n=1 Tax=Roseivivax sp. GX 12232 TaxID=2900547 RepID=UPI001E3E20F6|nr:DMT family transporter [Roseivivax sp. GX 12232]MCE0505751.1 DMT family transporter [Roseivivax sp. GX 12232]
MDIRGILMGLAFAAMWSSAFTSARVIVQAAPPLTTLALRFLISGIIAVGIARALGQSWRLTAVQWRAVLVFGLCQNAIYLGLNFVAMQEVQASLAAIIASAMPLIVALLSWAVLRERLPALGIAGLVAGVFGVTLIMGARLSGGADLFGVALCVLAALSLAVATLMVRNATSRGNVLMVVGLQMFVGAGALVLPAAWLETWEVTWSPALVVAFWYTVLVPGVLATLVWFLLVDRIGATKAATFHFLNPFFGVVIAWALLNEALTLWDALGVVVIAGGILAVQLARAKKAG